MKKLFSFFDAITEKKIIIMGLTNLTESLAKIFPWEISYFIDVEQQYVGKYYLNKPILSPNALLNENPDEIAVIIAGVYNVTVEEWLMNLGLKRNIHYWFGAYLNDWYSYHQSQTFSNSLCVVKVDGGLGSQMMQFAIGLLLKKKNNVKVKYDLSWFSISGKDICGKNNRYYCLPKVFNIDNMEVANEQEIIDTKAFNYYYHKKIFSYDPDLLQIQGSQYIDGYFNNYQYIYLIEEILKKQFKFKFKLTGLNLGILKHIQSEKISIAVHIRRGDYIGSVHEILDEDYYNRAMKFLAEKLIPQTIHFFIFSNDIEWVKQHIKSDYPITFVIGNNNDNGPYDMYLMSQCKHFIISNSSFGWWAAWLSNYFGKIVVSPDRWFNIHSPKMKDDFLKSIEGQEYGSNLPSGWIRLPVSHKSN